jgi:hypothetical protein
MMRVKQIIVPLLAHSPSSNELEELQSIHPQVVFLFGDIAFFKSSLQSDNSLISLLQKQLPHSLLVGCSTSGEILASQTHSGTLTATAIRFDTSQVYSASCPLTQMSHSEEVGLALAQKLDHPNLQHVLIFAPGVNINGSALVNGLKKGFTQPETISVSGGLAGDNGTFKQTFTIGPHGVSENHVVALGFHGLSLIAGSCARGGWTPFGPTRQVTKAEGNILYTVDHEPALDMYMRYLGKYANDLPASGLLFPLEIEDEANPDNGLIRTILGIDETQKALILAGELKTGARVRMMHASTQNLIEAAAEAAEKIQRPSTMKDDALALLVSCVGRKLIMGDMVDQEIETVADVLGDQTLYTGFYSNGEISAWNFNQDCRLHNQTMTITWLCEHQA